MSGKVLPRLKPFFFEQTFLGTEKKKRLICIFINRSLIR